MWFASTQFLLRKYKMKYEPFQAPPSDWLNEPGLAHLVEKFDGTSPLGELNRARLRDDAIKLAIEKGRRLRARAFRDAFTAVVRLAPRSIGLMRRTWRNLADERRALRELSALDDHLLRDIGIERIDVRSVVKSGIATCSAVHQGRRAKGNVFSWEKAAIASSTNTRS